MRRIVTTALGFRDSKSGANVLRHNGHGPATSLEQTHRRYSTLTSTRGYLFDDPRRAREGAGASGLSPIERLRHAWRARSNSLGREAGIYIWISDSVYHQLRPHPHRPLRLGPTPVRYVPRKMYSRSTRVRTGYALTNVLSVSAHESRMGMGGPRTRVAVSASRWSAKMQRVWGVGYRAPSGSDGGGGPGSDSDNRYRTLSPSGVPCPAIAPSWSRVHRPVTTTSSSCAANAAAAFEFPASVAPFGRAARGRHHKSRPGFWAGDCLLVNGEERKRLWERREGKGSSEKPCRTRAQTPGIPSRASSLELPAGAGRRTYVRRRGLL